uniref:Putative glycoside hydrolase n=1 Tax=viral metagenome TaxID=1070528 RepID=A0A6H1Z9S2_9ZZZZ
MKLSDLLRKDEGLRLKPYRDSTGHLTIGYGRNLDDNGISESEADILLQNDIIKATQEINQHLPVFYQLNEARRAVLINMCFNMGLTTLLKFKNTLKCIEVGNYAEASRRMLFSKWAKQVGNRAKRLSDIMLTGEGLTL